MEGVYACRVEGVLGLLGFQGLTVSGLQVQGARRGFTVGGLGARGFGGVELCWFRVF